MSVLRDIVVRRVKYGWVPTVPAQGIKNNAVVTAVMRTSRIVFTMDLQIRKHVVLTMGMKGQHALVLIVAVGI